jgi:hypothetical protein
MKCGVTFIQRVDKVIGKPGVVNAMQRIVGKYGLLDPARDLPDAGTWVGHPLFCHAAVPAVGGAHHAWYQSRGAFDFIAFLDSRF